MLNAIKEFSRYAHEYNSYNVIQVEVAASLVKELTSSHFTTLIDMGCGSGEVYKNVKREDISFEHFIAFDASKEMLAIHPSSKKIEKICADFNLPNVFEKISTKKDSLLLSSSALQWSKNLDFTLAQIAEIVTSVHFAIFTSGTFKTLHQTAEITSPIYSLGELKDSINRYYDVSYEVKEYKLHFETVREMFNYIKKSGVSGGDQQLSYKQTKLLMKQYPLDYLEFEVLFVSGATLEKSSI